MVLTAVGTGITTFGHDQTVVVQHKPSVGAGGTIPGWLIPIAGKPLHYQVAGVSVDILVFKPNWDILPAERFTTFPIFSA